MTEPRMSPEALEELARSVAAKVANNIQANQNLADNFMAEQQQNAEFRQFVKDELTAIRRERSVVPIIALSFSGVALLMSLVTLINTTSAVQSLSEQMKRMEVDSKAHEQQRSANPAPTPSGSGT